MRARLPYPPTINHYYGTDKRTGHKYLTDSARRFRDQVALLVNRSEGFGRSRVAILIDVHQPRRSGDIDNRIKPLLDALEHAGAFHNDRQVDDLRIRRSHNIQGGAVDVQIWEMGKCS
jgi:crossover junction endodeoxyribonuclease RusA